MLAARMVQKYLHQRHVADHDETQYEQTINKQQTNKRTAALWRPQIH